jgi:hypothetical protein
LELKHKLEILSIQITFPIRPWHFGEHELLTVWSNVRFSKICNERQSASVHRCTSCCQRVKFSQCAFCRGSPAWHRLYHLTKISLKLLWAGNVIMIAETDFGCFSSKWGGRNKSFFQKWGETERETTTRAQLTITV